MPAQAMSGRARAFASGTRVTGCGYVEDSEIPSTPGRLEPNSRIVPSQESDGRVSLAAVFTFGPRLNGVDQGSAMEFLVRAPNVGCALASRAGSRRRTVPDHPDDIRLSIGSELLTPGRVLPGQMTSHRPSGSCTGRRRQFGRWRSRASAPLVQRTRAPVPLHLQDCSPHTRG